MRVNRCAPDFPYGARLIFMIHRCLLVDAISPINTQKNCLNFDDLLLNCVLDQFPPVVQIKLVHQVGAVSLNGFN